MFRNVPKCSDSEGPNVPKVPNNRKVRNFGRARQVASPIPLPPLVSTPATSQPTPDQYTGMGMA